MRLFYSFPFVLALLCVSSFSGAAETYAHWYSDTQAIMGTQISATVWHEDEEVALKAIKDVMTEMRRIDELLSPYKETSVLSQLNRNAAKEPQLLSDELYFLIDKSLYFGRMSQGAFDITYASLGRYYDYREKLTPSEAQREALLPAINYKHLKLNKKDKTLTYDHPHVYLDLGGIAKGYAVDQAANIIKKADIHHASISAGGDSRIIGDRRGGLGS